MWKNIPGYEGIYQVSDAGDVRRIAPRRGGPRLAADGLRKLTKDRCGYLQVTFYKDGRFEIFRVHQLVAAAFLGPCPPGKEPNHTDGNKENNTPSNLEYLTHSENMRHAYDVLGRKAARGERASGAKATLEEVTRARAMIAAGASRLAIGPLFGRHRLWGYEITDGSTWKD